MIYRRTLVSPLQVNRATERDATYLADDTVPDDIAKLFNSVAGLDKVALEVQHLDGQVVTTVFEAHDTP